MSRTWRLTRKPDRQEAPLGPDASEASASSYAFLDPQCLGTRDRIVLRRTRTSRRARMADPASDGFGGRWI